jgi:hypothetical protein
MKTGMGRAIIIDLSRLAPGENAGGAWIGEMLRCCYGGAVVGHADRQFIDEDLANQYHMVLMRIA